MINIFTSMKGQLLKRINGTQGHPSQVPSSRKHPTSSVALLSMILFLSAVSNSANHQAKTCPSRTEILASMSADADMNTVFAGRQSTKELPYGRILHQGESFDQHGQVQSVLFSTTASTGVRIGSFCAILCNPSSDAY